MTKVVFYSDEKGMIWGFEASGHAGYAESGSDIVCAAISALTQATAGGLSEVVKAPLKTRMDEDTGYFSCNMQSSADQETLEKAQILLVTMKMALTEISRDYPGTIRIIIRERR
ncbi:MAG: ribosomal-processing cysteine protease Prp [Clostridia bacterium]|nr:ribosomal-processing cysteine protease Prp [Clostridia bacterium]